ncbi:MAG: hypothetical protein AAF823_02675 [Planctomycetota bacterium]
MQSIRIAACLLLAVSLIAGCKNRRVSIVTSPADVDVLVSVAAEGKRLDRGKPAPYHTSLSFPSDGGRVYVLQATPQGDATKYYKTTQLRVSEEQLLAAQSSDDQAARVEIELDLQPYVDLPVHELVFDAEFGWRAMQIEMRAYRDTREGGQATASARRDQPTFKGALPSAPDEYDAFHTASLAPDGRQLVYSAFTLGDRPVPPSESELRRMQRSGIDISAHTAPRKHLQPVRRADILKQNIGSSSTTRMIADGAFNFTPSMTPDSGGVLYASNTNRRDATEILIRNPWDGNGWTQLNSNSSEEAALMPSESPGGNIAYMVFRKDWQSIFDAEIRVIVEGQHGITTIAKGIHPSISPDGQRVAYIDNGELCVIDIRGRGREFYTTGSKNIIDAYAESLTPSQTEIWETFQKDRLFAPNSFPVWSPNGKWILFTSMSRSDPQGRPNEDIVAVRVSDGERYQITDNFSVDRMPMISPDGKTIYFVSNRDLSWAVWSLPTPTQLNLAN